MFLSVVKSFVFIDFIKKPLQFVMAFFLEMGILMKELIPINDYGIFASAKYEAMVDSRFVAEFFEKNHKNVLQAINDIIEQSGFSSEFRRLNFKPSSYVNSRF